MNKQESIDELKRLFKQAKTEEQYHDGRCTAYGYALKLAEQLDEPKAPEVVVPQWFADWIKKHERLEKGMAVSRLWVDFYMSSRDISRDFPKEQTNWLSNNKELATRAILDGYTVEKEQLYYVKFVEDDRSSYLNLEEEYNLLEVGDNRPDEDYKIKFTEAEIKAIDERYWPFAVPVEE